FFQAEDGIRDRNVTGVQTCALPILARDGRRGEREVHRVRAREGGGQRQVVALDAVARDVVHAEVDGRVAEGTREERAHVDVEGEIGRASCRERVEGEGGGVVWREER